jgi:hypothetical protein
MPISFDQLWEKSEGLFQDSISNETSSQILDELILKIKLYQAIDQKKEIPETEQQIIKSRTIGEILLTLTKLSLKDNLNVYEALNIAMQYRSIDQFSKKY